MKTHRLLPIAATAALACMAANAPAQDKTPTANDSNTPLHLLKPAYRTGYGVADAAEVKRVIDRVLGYISQNTPAYVVDSRTGKPVDDLDKIDSHSRLAQGAFRLTSYEWGVTYSAVQAAYHATGDKAYRDYAYDRMGLLAKAAPRFKAAAKGGAVADRLMRRVLTPGSLDDCGAICSAMIKARLDGADLPLDSLIANYFNFIANKEHRLADGTFARLRPYRNSVWLDDMFMGIPAVAFMGRYDKANSAAHYDEAVKQVRQFADRMFVKEKGLFRHGWVEGMADHPAYHWGRANGWALLTLCEVLDALPENHEGRAEVLGLLQAHVRGLAACQGKDGFWHQLLDRNDSYEETSATAIYVYCMAHAINKGWIDAMTYGPAVMLGWHAVASAVNESGQVEGVCVGTGMGFDPSFYYYRPVNVFAAHGYGPVIWAGAEMISLLKGQHPYSNDSAVLFYRTKQNTSAPIFGEK